jgi:hypothetical protein
MLMRNNDNFRIAHSGSSPHVARAIFPRAGCLGSMLGMMLGSYIIGWVSHVARACAALHHKLLNTFADSSQNLLYPYRLVLRHCCPRRLFDGVLPEPSHVHVYVPLGWQRSRRAYQARSAAAR